MATETTTFEYAPAPESRAVVDIRPSYGLFIGGDWADPADGTGMRTISPATEEGLSEGKAPVPPGPLGGAPRGHAGRPRGRRPRRARRPPRLRAHVGADGALRARQVPV